MNPRQLHEHNQRRRFQPRTNPSNMSSLNRYAVDHSRGRIVLRAPDASIAVERAKAMTPGSTGHYAVALPTFNPATQVAQPPITMTPKTKSEPKKKAAPKASPNKTLRDRVEKVATNKAPKPKAEKKANDGMSGLDAAAHVLKNAGTELNAKEVLAAIEADKLAPGLTGKTPHATLYAGMITEIAKKGKASRFKRGGQKGTFEFNAASE